MHYETGLQLDEVVPSHGLVVVDFPALLEEVEY